MYLFPAAIKPFEFLLIEWFLPKKIFVCFCMLRRDIEDGGDMLIIIKLFLLIYIIYIIPKKSDHVKDLSAQRFLLHIVIQKLFSLIEKINSIDC